MQFRLMTASAPLDRDTAMNDLKNALSRGNKEDIHKSFEAMFGEVITKSLMGVFFRRFSALSNAEKKSFMSDLQQRYKKYGEYGFATTVLQPLSRLGASK